MYHYFYYFNMFLRTFYACYGLSIFYEQYIFLYVSFSFCENKVLFLNKYGFEKLDLGVLDPSIV